MLLARLFTGVVLVACSKKPAPIAQADGPDGLRALFAQARAACEHDTAKGRAIVESLIPTAEQVATIVTPEAPAGFVDLVASQTTEIPASDDRAACLLSPPGRTEILVHRATTEELAAQTTAVASEEFPSGARGLAHVLRPQLTFYEVETVEPGKDRGTKFHMFYWDGERWRMLGPAWRYLPGEHPAD